MAAAGPHGPLGRRHEVEEDEEGGAGQRRHRPARRHQLEPARRQEGAQVERLVRAGAEVLGRVIELHEAAERARRGGGGALVPGRGLARLVEVARRRALVPAMERAGPAGLRLGRQPAPQPSEPPRQRRQGLPVGREQPGPFGGRLAAGGGQRGEVQAGGPRQLARRRPQLEEREPDLGPAAAEREEERPLPERQGGARPPGHQAGHRLQQRLGHRPERPLGPAAQEVEPVHLEHQEAVEARRGARR